MKTKKITALVLAALMAAGTTATAFADSDVVNRGGDLDDKRPLTFNDETIYENEDGVLTPSTDFRPGDTLYIRLDELNANGDKKIEDEKDDMNVYADWKVGKDAVESVDIVYKKGNYFNNLDETTFTFTVDGVKFEINGKGLETDVAVKNAILAELKTYQASHPDFLKDEIAAQMENYAGTVYAFTYGGETKNFATAKEALEAAGWKYGTYYTYDGKVYENTDVVAILTAAGGNNSGATSKYYADSDSASNGYGTYSDSDMSEGSLTGDCYIFTNGQKFVDSSVITTVEDLMSTKVVDGIEKKENVFKSADTLLGEKDALAAEKTVSAVNGYVENGTVLTEDQAKSKAAAEAVAAAAANAATEYGVSYKNNYTYWVEIKTKEDDTTKVLDLAGVLRIGSTKNKAEDATNAFQLDTSLDNRVYDSGAYVTVEDEWTFAPDSRSVVKFSDDAEDVVLYFGENEAAWFEFDARGQSALNLEFTFDFNKEIADLFPEANIDFLTFTSKPATNRTGDLYIVADEDTYLYEVTDDGVKTVAYLPAGGTGSAAVSAALGVKNINGAEYDEKEGAWHIRTRKLGAYAISDTELDTSRTLDGDESSSESGNSGNNNGTKPIPDTGR